jgi:hypothetical protein
MAGVLNGVLKEVVLVLGITIHTISVVDMGVNAHAFVVGFTFGDTVEGNSVASVNSGTSVTTEDLGFVTVTEAKRVEVVRNGILMVEAALGRHRLKAVVHMEARLGVHGRRGGGASSGGRSGLGWVVWRACGFVVIRVGVFGAGMALSGLFAREMTIAALYTLGRSAGVVGISALFAVHTLRQVADVGPLVLLPDVVTRTALNIAHAVIGIGSVSERAVGASSGLGAAFGGNGVSLACLATMLAICLQNAIGTTRAELAIAVLAVGTNVALEILAIIKASGTRIPSETSNRAAGASVSIAGSSRITEGVNHAVRACGRFLILLVSAGRALGAGKRVAISEMAAFAIFTATFI